MTTKKEIDRFLFAVGIFWAIVYKITFTTMDLQGDGSVWTFIGGLLCNFLLMGLLIYLSDWMIATHSAIERNIRSINNLTMDLKESNTQIEILEARIAREKNSGLEVKGEVI